MDKEQAEVLRMWVREEIELALAEASEYGSHAERLAANDSFQEMIDIFNTKLQIC